MAKRLSCFGIALSVCLSARVRARASPQTPAGFHGTETFHRRAFAKSHVGASALETSTYRCHQRKRLRIRPPARSGRQDQMGSSKLDPLLKGPEAVLRGNSLLHTGLPSGVRRGSRYPSTPSSTIQCSQPCGSTQIPAVSPARSPSPPSKKLRSRVLSPVLHDTYGLLC